MPSGEEGVILQALREGGGGGGCSFVEDRCGKRRNGADEKRNTSKKYVCVFVVTWLMCARKARHSVPLSTMLSPFLAKSEGLIAVETRRAERSARMRFTARCFVTW